MVPRERDASFLLSWSEDGGLEWKEVECDDTPTRTKHLLDRKGAVVSFSELYEGYFASIGVSDTDLMRSILTAPWVPRAADGVRFFIYMWNASGSGYERTQCSVSRHNLAGRLGQLLWDAGDAACKSAIAIAAIDAFVWLRNFLANGSFCYAFLLYPIIGLLVGVLLYLLGLSLKYLFNHFYGQTPAAKIVGDETKT
jgi:hypothetical protein